MMSAKTRYLARLIGWFLIIVSLAMLVQKQGLALAITALVHDRAALLVAAMVGLAAGLAMVLAHNVWSGGVVPVAVTVIGWFLMLRNAFILFLPAESLVAVFDAFHIERLYYLYAVIDLLIGFLLVGASVRR
ncbi:MAG TPA: hypothetical protein VMS64_22985 [Candidatus Methylomirabilis sp.]|nr:hypothetical protein [Candidatus Methylomirabilis sp.]